MNATEIPWYTELEQKYLHLFECMERDGVKIPVRGIEVGEGWKDLITEMLDRLNRHLENNSRKGEENFIKIFQAKEKFGDLRVYITASERLYDGAERIVANAEGKAEQTCESCGKLQKGCIRSVKGWVYCLCDECLNAAVPSA
jgi:hypothetical protein